MLSAVVFTLYSFFVSGDFSQTPYQEDIQSALDQIEKECGDLLDLKEISFMKLEKEFTKRAKKIKTDQDEFVLLVELLARLEDGHARVQLTEKTKGLLWPEDDSLYDSSITRGDSGLAVCRIGKKYYVKAVAGPAKDANLQPGSEILKIGGQKPGAWLEEKIEEARRIVSWSTEHQAFFWATHGGLSGEAGSRLKVEVKQFDGKKKKRTISIGKSRVRMPGPAFWPEGLTGEKDVSHTLLPGGYGYLYIRRCKSDLPEQVDVAMEALGNPRGLIIDFRGNSGGGFDHDDLLGRFVPEGQTMSFVKSISSTGSSQYGGPIIVIVDGTVVSAGETASGMFKEEGRGYMIGESPTAGMSAAKITLDLPTGKFKLYVSRYSNKGRWQEGKGIEGLGIQPHQLVEFRAEDLAKGKDTLILEALSIFEKWPEGEVPYQPQKFGWKASAN
ncbi:MAG: hypothetical protein COA70_05230 [Planctomycetota bacterium]|nr:MAG: hypothetical protein COA70_05230 [Planctomycetota bacterium]